ncbi:MAG: 4-hydroxythreonine-4-phosphate dehydrogenase PdxA [Planctomycetota bacterium]|jgi:4-hydroxythreonine-4-phosphate dehydrogenase
MTASDDSPLLAITPGDPAGVGPEIAARIVADDELRSLARLLVVGDGEHLRARARRVGAVLDIARVESAGEMRERSLDAAWLGGLARAPDEGVIGRVDAEGARASVEWARSAARLALDGTLDGIVTGPVNKLAVAEAGFAYEGHTELLAEVCGSAPVMMLVGGGFRVALVTRHVALRAVAGTLVREEIVRVARVVDEALRREFGLDAPRIGVLALNPHASDGGRFGHEEKWIIGPAIDELRASGVRAEGPLVPDVAFRRALDGSHDAVVAMYHDQGLIPLKTVAFDTGVNVTLGLPITRTSPDHGTAFDIAGKGEASATSFAEAVKLAARMARNRGSTP